MIAPHDPRIYTSITSTSTVFQLPWTRRQKCWHLWSYAKWRGSLWWFCHCHNNPHDAVRSKCPVDTSPLIPDLSTYLEVLRGGTTVEKSTMAYLEIMDEIADRKDTSFFSVSNPWLQGKWSCFSTFSSSSASHCTRRRQQSQSHSTDQTRFDCLNRGGWKPVISDMHGIAISATWWRDYTGCHWGP